MRLLPLLAPLFLIGQPPVPPTAPPVLEVPVSVPPVKDEWPGMPKWMKYYEPTQWTQRIAVTNSRDTIQPVPRSNLERKWQVSGGMADIDPKLWRSDKYQWAGSRSWIDNIQVWNGAAFQPNRGLVHSYADTSRFDDVLINRQTGKVFEHRSREKVKGSWTEKVLYRDPEQYPRGYNGLKVTCSSCHDQAGSGGYAVGMVPGSDTVFSDPLEWSLAQGMQ